MKNNFYMHLYSIMLVPLLLAPCSYAEEKEYLSREQCLSASVYCDSLSVRGEFYKVIDALYQQDFKDEIKEISKVNNDQDKDPRHYLDLTKIENFDFFITKDEKENKYHISVGPKIRFGGPVYFGATNYELDIKTLKILKKYKEK